MESCKRCDTSSWMVSLTENGLCRRCNLIVVNRVQVAAEHVCRSLAMYRQVDEVEGRLRYAVRVLRHARVLGRYEEMGIETIRPAPSHLAELFEAERGRLRREVAESEDSDAVRTGSDGAEPESVPSPEVLELADPMDPLGSFDRVRRSILDPDAGKLSE